MTKKEEINKSSNFVIGIAAFAIIAIAIIVAINFIPKSHAQSNDSDSANVAMSTLNKSYSKSLSGVDKWSKDPMAHKDKWAKNVKKDKGNAFSGNDFENKSDKFADKDKGDFSAFAVKDQEKAAFTFAAAKDKDVEKSVWEKVEKKPSFNFGFHFDKTFQS